jgi:hypothetical protein
MSFQRGNDLRNNPKNGAMRENERSTLYIGCHAWCGAGR